MNLGVWLNKMTLALDAIGSIGDQDVVKKRSYIANLSN